ncbi:hypothetical protein LJB86_04955 [Deltaproteobacteria bacterium OttesenSCG-928-M10]|nr:hypothetical protein [Deltaproteobacteria bacterium OttesenSCG-928-M10]
MWLTACSPKPCPPARPLAPPAAFMQTVPEPACTIKTNGDLVDCLVETRHALRLANRHALALRQWAEGQGLAETDPAP